jgi:hypothetical protein
LRADLTPDRTVGGTGKVSSLTRRRS